MRGVGDRIEVLLPHKRVGEVLGEALAAGAQVVSVTPRRASLEDLFLSAVERGARRVKRARPHPRDRVNTVREAIRHRVLYTLLFFALALIGTGVLLSTLSYVESDRILQDVGFAAIRVFAVAIAIFVGIGLVHREVDRRTIFTILSKPISRSEFLLGKYVGPAAHAVAPDRRDGARLRRRLAGSPARRSRRRPRGGAGARRRRGRGGGGDRAVLLRRSRARCWRRSSPRRSG